MKFLLNKKDFLGAFVMGRFNIFAPSEHGEDSNNALIEFFRLAQLFIDFK